MRRWAGRGAPAFFLPRRLDSTISTCVGNGRSRCRTAAHRSSDLPGGLHLAALQLLLCVSTQVLRFLIVVVFYKVSSTKSL
jgi:hypothetical protein